MFRTQNNMDQNRTTNINIDMQQKEKENQGEQKNIREVQQGTISREFQFEKQKERIEQILQRTRSQEYLAVFDIIDYLSSDDEAIIERLKENVGEEFVEDLDEMSDEEIFEMIAQAFHEEFAELETNLDDNLLAVIAACYIDGCDCHAIDKHGHIIEHYKSEQKLSDDLERGRTIYREHADQCQCVEIYKTCCRVISYDGDVEVIKNK